MAEATEATHLLRSCRELPGPLNPAPWGTRGQGSAWVLCNGSVCALTLVWVCARAYARAVLDLDWPSKASYMVSSTRHRNRESILLQDDSFTLAPHVLSVYVQWGGAAL